MVSVIVFMEYRPLVAQLSRLYHELLSEEGNVRNGEAWQQRLDENLASILSINPQITLMAREFRQFRLPLVKGKAPYSLTKRPDLSQLETYARRLVAELDIFLRNSRRRHRVSVISSPEGIATTIELLNSERPFEPIVREAAADERDFLAQILSLAAKQYFQWIYVRRSVRAFSGNKVYLCKPARQMEWSETRALLDAADIIAEVTDVRGRRT